MAYRTRKRNFNKQQKQMNEVLKREEQNVRALKRLILDVGESALDSKLGFVKCVCGTDCIPLNKLGMSKTEWQIHYETNLLPKIAELRSKYPKLRDRITNDYKPAHVSWDDLRSASEKFK